MKEDTLRKRYVLKLLANTVSGIINALIIAVVPKSLGPVAFGNFSYLQQFFNQLISFLDLNTSTAFFTKLSSDNNRKELIVLYSYFSLIMLLVLLTIVYIIDFFGMNKTLFSGIERESIYLGAVLGFITWLVQIYIKISDAYAQTVLTEVIKVGHKIVVFILLLLLVGIIDLELNTYIYFQLLSLIGLILSIAYILNRKDILNVKIYSERYSLVPCVKEFYRYCNPLVFFLIISIGIGMYDIWLLKKISGARETSYYALAFSISAMCLLFTSAMIPIIMREYSKYFGNRDIDNIKKLFCRYVPLLYSTSAFFCIFVSFNSDTMISIFTDERYADAYLALVVMAFYPIHQTYGQMTSALFFATENINIYKNIGLVTSFFGLLLSYIFVYKLEMGGEGLALKMVLTQFISVNVQLYFNVKFLKIKISGFIFKQFSSVAILLFGAYLTQVTFFEFPVYNFFMSGFLYSLFVICSVFILPKVFGLERKDIKWIVALVKR